MCLAHTVDEERADGVPASAETDERRTHMMSAIEHPYSFQVSFPDVPKVTPSLITGEGRYHKRGHSSHAERNHQQKKKIAGRLKKQSRRRNRRA